MIIAPAVMLHKYWLQSKKLRAAKRRGYLFDAPPAPHAQLGPSLVDLDSLSRAHPQRFYLPDASFEALSDCYARVEGVRLPLHGQVRPARRPNATAGLLGTPSVCLVGPSARMHCLHSTPLLLACSPPQVLAARCSVLRQLFVAQAEDGAGAAPTASSQVRGGAVEAPLLFPNSP